MLPPLIVRIGAETADLDRAIEAVAGGMNRLEDITRTAGQRISAFGQSTQALGRRMLPLSAGVTAAAGAMLGLAVNTANAGNEIDKASQAAGMAPGPFQELRYAIGQLSDVTSEQFNQAMRTLATRMGLAAAGNEQYAETIDALGISMNDVQSGAATTDEVFQALANHLAGAESAAEAAAIASRLLGEEAGARLGPALRNAGADVQSLRDEARSLGLVLSDDVVAQSAAATDQISRIRQGFGAAGTVIGAAMLPVLTQFGNFIESTILPGLTSLAGHIGTAIEWFGALPEPVQQAAGVIAAAIGVGGPVLMAVGAMTAAFGAIVAATGPIGLFIAAASALYAAWQVWGDDIMALIGQVTTYVTETFNSVVTYFAELPGRFVQFGRDIITGLWNGLRAAWDEFSITDMVSGWAGNIRDGFADLLGIRSPSQVFHEFGINIGQGLANGISAGMGLAERAMQTSASALTGDASSMVSSVLGSLGQLFQGSKTFAIAQALINTWQGITQALTLPFPQNLVAAAQVAAQGFAAVNSIRSTNPGSGGGGSAGSGAVARGGGSSGGTNIYLDVQPNARGDIPMETFRGVIGSINDQLNRGGRIVA